MMTVMILLPPNPTHPPIRASFKVHTAIQYGNSEQCHKAMARIQEYIESHLPKGAVLDTDGGCDQTLDS